MKLYHWIIIGVIAISCTKPVYYSPDKIKYVNTQNTYDTLKAEALPVSVLVPQQITFIDSLLVIITRNPTELISIIDTQNDSLIANICLYGRGPNEYLNPFTLKQFHTNKSRDKLLYIADNSNIVKSLNLTQTIYKKEAVCEPPIPVNTSLYYPFFLSSQTTFLKQQVTYNDPRDYVFFPPKYIIKDIHNTKEYKIYPDIIKNPRVRTLPLFLYGAITRIKPDLTKIVDVMGSFDNMNILEITSGKCLSIQEENTYSFENLAHSNIDELAKILKYCALDVCVTNEYIIILYDGRSADDVNNQTLALKPLIKIFNWEGDFLQAYQISEPLQGIAYDEKNKRLYGFDKGECFYRYLLPN